MICIEVMPMTVAAMPRQHNHKEGLQPHPGRRMTEQEFTHWLGEKTRAEWVDGEVVMMAPVSLEHADLGLWLASVLRFFVEHHDLGMVYGPEYMVRLGKERRRRMPDVLFVAKSRSAILRPNHVEGAPDLIIEVVSPDSTSRDWREKYLEYEQAQVREYWIVDPISRRMEAHALSRAKKYHPIEVKDGRIASALLPGFHLKPEWLFGAKRAKGMTVLREMGVAT
jgi:Uma2 family endonuclease